MPHRIKSGIAARVEELKNKAKAQYNLALNPIIQYTVKGSCAGYAEFETQVLDFHLGLAVENEQVFVQTVVGHEFCHLVANEVYGHQGHGGEWKEIMRSFDLKPDRCHKLDVSNFIRKPKTYPYACTCNTYSFGRQLHYKLQAGLFECNGCKGLVKFSGGEKELRRFKAGTHENRLMVTLAEYKKLLIPMNDQILLIMDLFKVSYGTARSYYYEYRPKT